MIKKLFTAGAFVALGSLATTLAHAAPIVYFGEDQNPGESVTDTPRNARNSFLAALAGVSSEGFEGFSTGATPPLALSFTGSAGTLGATLNGGGSISSGADGAGRFNTTAAGTKYFVSAGVFNISFSTAIAAFGFYGTDIGDFDGQVVLTLTASSGAVSTLTVPNTVNGANGSLLFYGFIDSDQTYTNVGFGNTAAGTDVFGFDDMVIGDRGQVTAPPGGVPEPGSLALVGMGLLGLGALRRKTHG